MTTIEATQFSDQRLLVELDRAAAAERHATAALLVLLGEVDARQLYLGEGYPSLFQFAMRRLHLSEPAAYSRITAARAARRYPAIVPLIDSGALSLTTVGLLTPHLTDDNVSALLEAARFKTKRETEAMVAALHPQPDIPSSVRMLPASRVTAVPVTAAGGAPPLLSSAVAAEPAVDAQPVPAPPMPTSARAVVAPLSPRRYLIRMTIGEETQQKLTRARDLLRHVIPDGDPAQIFDRALTVLLERVERTRMGATARPRRRATVSKRHSRYVPAEVRRAVWARDEGRCTFVGPAGRCEETGGLEIHHVNPFAKGGPTTVVNLALRCRAHNAYEGALAFGHWRTRVRTREELRPDGVASHPLT